MNYFKILRFVQHGNANYLDIPTEQQAYYISKLGEPKDDIDRSYKQYLCQRFFEPQWKKALLDLMSAILFFPTILILFIRGLMVKKCENIDAYGSFYGIEEILPDELKNKFRIEVRNWDEKKALFKENIKPILLLFMRHSWSPLFLLKCTIKLSMYSYIIRSYEPRAIIVHNEPSYTNSFLTMCCEKYGVKHINVMHGEKLYNIRDSFFRFDEFYVWSNYYIELFKSLNVEMSQMRICIPRSLKIDIKKYINPDVYGDFKYFLSIYTEQEIKSIVESMQFVKKQNKTVKYRPHPRYSNISLLKKYVNESEIEWPQKVGILESISNLEYAVGSYSTVLTQAYLSGKCVILDNVTYKLQYEKLKSHKYILSNVGLPTLSHYQQECN